MVSKLDDSVGQQIKHRSQDSKSLGVLRQDALLLYSLFTCVTAFAQTWWQIAVLRFFVALGVGGEWAVASAFVSEVFPKHARAWSGAVFHGSSVLGTYLAIAAGAFIVNNPSYGWRWGFGIGAFPALLTLWIRWRLKEPEAWIASREKQSAARSPFAVRRAARTVRPQAAPADAGGGVAGVRWLGDVLGSSHLWQRSVAAPCS